MSKDRPFEVIHSYSRRQAIADGVLVDVTEAALEAGFVYPVALTSSVWSRCVAVPSKCPWQDESGRLWDVLWMLLNAIRQNRDENPLSFSLHVQNDERPAQLVTLKAQCGPGDIGEPVITVMMPDED
ncbi:DUF6573 family protein [Crateriforma conspicua]|uniref:DUF6573 family protein n=1 Tax=Crateriforma conspicua TaxID=2527996 RepID=UPI00118A6031|nr:DUF6573 family protein [Crateriforma conspicua]QDV62013.1 hypothetical protein Mal65_11410 [Crateriforma conspicua]